MESNDDTLFYSNLSNVRQRREQNSESTSDRYQSSPYQRHNRYYQTSPASRTKRNLIESLDNVSESHDELHFSMLRDGSPQRETQSYVQSNYVADRRVPNAYDSLVKSIQNDGSSVISPTLDDSKLFHVVVRIRPTGKSGILSNEEGAKVIDLGPDMKTLIVGKNLRKHNSETYPSYQFTFDRVFDEFTNQNLLYQKCVSPMTRAVMRGVNCSVFAYGQTRSGKSYTLEGLEQERRGLIPRAVDEIFKHIKLLKSRSTTVDRIVVKASYLQIYNDVVSDLLTFNAHNLKVLDKPVHVVGLKHKIIQEPIDIQSILRAAKNNRNVAVGNKPPDLYARSHTILTIYVEQYKQIIEPDEESRRNKPSQYNVLRGKINFVELAGSEKARDLNQLFANSGLAAGGSKIIDDGVKITKTFNALATVVAFLSRTGKHVPYRDSKLTHILRDSLHSLALSLFITTLYPLGENYQETLATSKFASRIRQSAGFLSPTDGRTSNTSSPNRTIRQNEEQQSIRPRSAGASVLKRTQEENSMRQSRHSNRSLEGTDQEQSETEKLRSEVLLLKKERHKLLSERRSLDLLQPDDSSEVESLRKELSKMKKERNKLLQEKTTLEVLNPESNEEVDHLRKELEKVKKEKSKLAHEKKALESSILESSSITSVDKYNTSLQERELKMEVDDMKRHLHEATSTKKKLESEISLLKDQFANSEHDKNEYHARLLDADLQISELSNLNTQLRSKLLIAERSIERTDLEFSQSKLNLSGVSSLRDLDASTHDIELLKSLSKLKEQNNRVEEERNQLQSYVQNLNFQLEESRKATLDISQESRDEQVEHILSLEKQVRDLKDQLENCMKQLREPDSRVSLLEGQVKHLTVQLEEARGVKESHDTQRIEELETQVTELSRQLDVKLDQSSAIAQVTTVTTESSQTRIESERLRSQVKDLQKQLEESRKRRESPAKVVEVSSDSDEQVKMLIRELELERKKVERLQANTEQVVHLQEQVRSLKHELEQAKQTKPVAQHDKVEHENTRLYEQIRTLTTELERTKLELERRPRSIPPSPRRSLQPDLSLEVKSLQEKLRIITEERDNMKTNLDGALEQVTRITFERDDITKQLLSKTVQGESSPRVQKIFAEKSKLEKELNTMRKQLQESFEENQKLRIELSNLRKMVQQLRADNQEIDEELGLATTELQTSQDELNNINIENASLQDTIAQLESEKEQVLENNKESIEQARDIIEQLKGALRTMEEQLVEKSGALKQAEYKLKLLEDNLREANSILDEERARAQIDVQSLRKEVAKYKQERDTEVERLHDQHQQELKELHDRSVIELKKVGEASSKESANHKREMSNLNEKYREEISRIGSAIEQQQQDMKNLREQHAKELNRVRGELSRDLNMSIEESTQEIDSLKEDHQAEINRMKHKYEQLHAEELSKLRLEHNNDLAQVKSKCELDKVAEIGVLRQEHSQELNQLKQELQHQHQVETNRLKSEKISELERLRDEHKTQLDSITFALNDARKDKEAVILQLSDVRTTLVQLRQLSNDSLQALQMSLSLSGTTTQSSPSKLNSSLSPTMNQSFSGSVIAEIVDQILFNSQNIYAKSKAIMNHMEDFNEQLNSITRERDRLQSVCREREKQVQGLESELDAISRELEIARDEKHHIKREVLDRDAQLQRIRFEQETLQFEADKMKTQLERSELARESLKQEILDTNTRLSKIQQEAAQNLFELERSTKELRLVTDERDGLVKQLHQTQQNLTDTANRLDTVQTTLKSVQLELDRLIEERNQLLVRIQMMEESARLAAVHLNEKEILLNEAQHEIAELNKENEYVTSQVRDTQIHLEQSKEEAKMYQTRANELDVELQKLITELEAVTNESQARIDEFKLKKQGYEQEKKELVHDLEQARNAIDASAEELQTLQSIIETQRSEQHALKEELARVKRDYEQITLEEQEGTTENDLLRKTLRLKEQALREHESQLDLLGSNMEHFENLKSRFDGEINQLKSQLDNRTMLLERCNEECARMESDLSRYRRDLINQEEKCRQLEEQLANATPKQRSGSIKSTQELTNMKMALSEARDENAQLTVECEELRAKVTAYENLRSQEISSGRKSRSLELEQARAQIEQLMKEKKRLKDDLDLMGSELQSIDDDKQEALATLHRTEKELDRLKKR